MRTETRVGMFVLGAIGVFFYLSFTIGVFRIDKHQYVSYTTYFDDTGGLDIRSSVKIAGVDVGWVESIVLLEGGKAEVRIMVAKKNRLAKNAYAVIQQVGLIGTKILEIEPGDPSVGYLPPGSTLSMPGKAPASIGDLIDQFRDIASSIQDIALSFRDVFASTQGEANMRKAIRGLATASEHISDVSQTLNTTIKRNEKNINGMLQDFRNVAHHLDYSVPQVSNTITSVSGTLHDSVFPSITKSLNSIRVAFAEEALPQLTDKISDVSDKTGSAFTAIEDTAVQAHDTFKEAGETFEKINTGKGVIGKLINEDETYTDIKKTLSGFKKFVNKAQSLGVQIDMHTENMIKTTLSKGYFELKLRPSTDYFYLLQLAADENGKIVRDVVRRDFRDQRGNRLDVEKLVTSGRDKLRFAQDVKFTSQRRNDILWGLQFGKRFNRVTLRVGMFESTFGAAIDYYVPLTTNKVHWVTSFEAFDLRGTNRFDDTRPHLKWINKAYFFKNIYTTFGIDDFYSKKSGTPFFGGGLRFTDNDLKYFFSMLPIGALAK